MQLGTSTDGWIELSTLARLRISTQLGLAVVWPDGTWVDVQGTTDLVPDSTTRFAWNDEDQWVLLVGLYSSFVYRVDIRSFEVIDLFKIERSPERGFARAEILVIDHDLVVDWEVGTAYVEDGRNIRWQVTRQFVNQFFRGTDANKIWFRDSVTGQEFAYDLETGELVA